MSFLAPLYIAGIAAVTLPVLFHLIRRTPRGEAPFSSLMFLSPSPPRITRRSRIEHWLLLILRGLALALLAFAFARPFWRQPARADDADASVRRIAVLIDSSASMRRSNLWRQALAAARDVVADARPQDQISLYQFDETLRPVATFDDMAQVEPGRRGAVIEARLKELEPTWAATHLGQALLDAVAALGDARDSSEEVGLAARQIVLFSDMQSGSRLNVLGDYSWPAEVVLELKPLTPAESTNAGLWRLADDDAAAASDEPARSADARQHAMRIRVANASDSQVEQFRLQWRDATTGGGAPAASGPKVDAYVPPGESRVVRVPPPPDALERPRLVLGGDAHDFDNTLYCLSAKRAEIRVAYLGDDDDNDPQGMRYYLERAVTSDPSRSVRVDALGRDDDLEFDETLALPLVVATRDPTPAQARVLRRYLEDGGTLLYVVVAAGELPGLASLLALDELTAEEATVDDYAMLGEIDFTHPLFAAMAGPKFNDFSQIRFWRRRRLQVENPDEFRSVARFEDGDPAILERRMGAGRLLIMTAGWQPADGQLARSWKFLLMLSSLVDSGVVRGFRTEYVVNERVALPDRVELADEPAVVRPDGSKVLLPHDAAAFDSATEPGMYALAGAKGPIAFAVNIDPLESNTSPLAAEAFEQLGCRLAGRVEAAKLAEDLQQLRDVELESRQRIWQWLVAVALAILIVETWLAGRLSRPLAPIPAA